MKTDEPRDDEILGRALSRAIETSEVNETPYDRSRIGMRPLKRGTSFWRVAALAASIVVAGALGSTLLERPAIDGPAAASPTVSAGSSSPVTTPGPAVATAPQDQIWVYFARDGLPPIGGFATGSFDNKAPESRILSRLNALRFAKAAPAGAANAFAPPTPTQSGSGTFGLSVSVIQGDLVTVEFDLSNGWGVRGSAQSLALVQQLVYTITEEPGVRHTLIKEKGKPNAVIDQLVIEKPLTREDVSGYGTLANETITEDQSRPCAPTCPSPSPARLSNNYSVDTLAPGMARFVVQVDSGDWETFTVSGRNVDDTKASWMSKYGIQIKIKGTEIKPGIEIVDKSPLRAIQSVTTNGSTTYELAVDDQRPWRVALLPNPDRIVVDIGGYPTSLSDTVAVYSPRPGDSGRQFTVSGLSRTYEATTQWRVVDSARRELAKGFTTASRGTSAVWGTYQISVQLPASVSGNVTLEVYWGSPRDGSAVGLVQVPLTVR
jgi:hypothetical protein